jgi:hypothetical protein
VLVLVLVVDLCCILSSVTEMRCVVYVFNVSESQYYVLNVIYKYSVSCNAQAKCVVRVFQSSNN